MRFLSTRRRHPAMRPLLLLLALVAIGVGYASLAPSPRVSADAGLTQRIDEGRKIFAVQCSSCHGLNGEGTSQGPSLVGVGSASVDFQVATGRMPANKPESQVPARQNTFSPEEIRAMGDFVQSLGPGVAVPNASQYDPSGLTAEQLAKGGELFRANCSACHNFEGAGGALPEGRYAPPLLHTSDKHIWEAMRIGPQQMPVFSEQVMTDQDVRMIIGYLKSLHQQPSSGWGFGGLGPVAEGMWAWIVGIGGLCLFAVWIASKGGRAK